MRKYYLIIALLMILLIENTALASQTEPQQAPQWLSIIETYAKSIGGIFATLTALFGIPFAYLQIRKTKAEITKLEAEAKEIKKAEKVIHGNLININRSNDINIQILADPRFLGPLLLLLDFIISWVVLTLADYAFNMVIDGIIAELLEVIVGAVLLIPILIQAIRIKNNFHQDENNEISPSNTVNHN